VRDGKDFLPESFFFEKDGNTMVSPEGIPNDFIEKSLSEIDNRVSKLFDKIRDSDANTRYNVTEDDMPVLQHFASVLYWRSPANEDQVKHLIAKYDLKELGLVVKSKSTNQRDEGFEDRIKNDPHFYKFLRLMLPNLTYHRILACSTPLKIQSFPVGLPAMCSDNPLIFERTIFPDIYLDDFILPISSTLLFIRGRVKPAVHTRVKLLIDLILLKQAKKYVSCTDPSYIDALNELYFKRNHSLDICKQELFDLLLKKKSY
jgi:hypothetical protein